METLSFITLDVFTLTRYSGNPLSIVNIPSSHAHLLSQEKTQLIAREFNLSETVFLHEQEDKDVREWVIDIFTTNDELPFAGHPTIGAACYVLGMHFGDAKGGGKGVFITKAGRIPISLISHATDMKGDMRVQADIPHNVHIHAHSLGDLQMPIPGLSSDVRLAKAEKCAPIVSIVRGMSFLLVRLGSLEVLGLVQNTDSALSFRGLLDEQWREGFVARYFYVVEEGLEDQVEVGGRLVNGGTNGIVNREKGDGVVRVRTRMLEEAMEDPATGSAACALGCYLALKSGRTQRFEVVQGVEMGRRSVIGVEVVLDSSRTSVESVRLSGSAVKVMEGTLNI